MSNDDKKKKISEIEKLYEEASMNDPINDMSLLAEPTDLVNLGDNDMSILGEGTIQITEDVINCGDVMLRGDGASNRCFINVFNSEFGEGGSFEFLATHPLTDNRISQTRKMIGEKELLMMKRHLVRTGQNRF